MIPQFVDRSRELDYLEKIYGKKGFSLVIIYGRRRVGKTTLLKEFIKNKKGCYILLTNESIKENIKYFKNCLAESLGKESYRKLDVDNFYDLFSYVEFGNEKFIIVFDEFPYLLDIEKGILSTFQKIVDEILSEKNVMLILSGSSISMMENDVIGYRSPLYGRNLNIWKVQPFDFKTIYKMFGDLNIAINAYFIFGNIPYYLNFYDPSKSLEMNIQESILTKGFGLYDEPLILLREEFRESRIYRLILKYISLGYQSIGKLCSVTGMDKSNLSKYLDSLKETGLVDHIVPLGKRRGGIYEISDPFMDFWFRFVYPYRSDLEIGNAKIVLSVFEKEKDLYFGKKFERLILDLLKQGTFPELKDFKDFTKWWYKDKEIDIVGINEDKLLLGECKWKENVNGKDVLNELKEKAKDLNWKGKIEYAVFSKSFSKRPENAYSYDLADIEKFLE